MSPSIRPAVDFALAQQGKPYIADDNRFGPDHYDCSGLVVAALRAAGIAVPRNALASPSILQWGMDSHTTISVNQAIHSYGALLIKGGLDGWGPLGHICFSLGNGRTMEAMGTAYGCRIGNAAGRGWSNGMLVPGADYGNAPTPPPAPPIPIPVPREENSSMFMLNGEAHRFEIFKGDVFHQWGGHAPENLSAVGRRKIPGFGPMDPSRPIEFIRDPDHNGIVYGQTTTTAGYLCAWVYLGGWDVTAYPPA